MNYTWMNPKGKLGKLAMVGILAGMLLVGCSRHEEAASTLPDRTEESAAFEQNPSPGGSAGTAEAADPKVENSKPAAKASDAEPMDYSAEQKQEISEAAEKAGLKKVYVPSIGLGTDDYLDRVETGDHEIRIVFVRGVITESSKPLKPTTGSVSSREVQISDHLTGEWIQDEGGPGYLYYEIAGTYFSMKSAKTFDQSEYEAAAASLEELNEHLASVK